VIELWFHLVFFYLAALLPFGAWRRMAHASRLPESASPDPRRPTTARIYRGVIVGHWLTAGTVVGAFWWFGIPLGTLGLAAPRTLPLLISGAVLLLGWVVWSHYQARALIDPAKVARLRARFENISLLVPVTPAEERAWLLVALTAGVCEEVLYRGFVGFYLGRWMPLPAVALVGSLVFGVAHLYQGPNNALRTAAVGAIHWALYLATGSILPGMALHAALDVRSGQVLRQVFAKPLPAAA
jgi:membrane protease YdiL (CAAX protease family)